jgi:hypothetical protein
MMTTFFSPHATAPPAPDVIPLNDLLSPLPLLGLN